MSFDKAKEIFLNPHCIRSIAKKEAKHELACALVDEMEPGLNYRVQMIERTFPQFSFGAEPEEKYAVRIKAEEFPTATEINNPRIIGTHADVITVDTIKDTFREVIKIYESLVPTEPVYYLTAKQLDRCRQTYLPWPSHVIFHPPATVVFWDDDTKTVVKCMEDEEFNPEVGLAMCFCKKAMGDGYKRWFKDALEKGGWKDDT